MRRALLLSSILLVALGAAPLLAIVPTAVELSSVDLEAVDAVRLPALDLVAVAAEDARRAEEDRPHRFAIPHPVAISAAERGTWEDLGDGRLLWRLRIQAAEATSINLAFRPFHLPEGAQLLLYSADLAEIVRPFTALDNRPERELWSPLVATDDLVVELTLPRSRRGEVELGVASINQGYADLAQARTPESGSCEMDVACLDGADPWRDNVRSVGAITLGGSDDCSGSLVNNTAADHKMYFMTANHCGINSGNANTVVVYWNYQNSTCRTPGSAASGQAGDGQRNQFASGWTFRAARSQSDFTLIEYLGAVDSAWNLFWAGWDHTAGDADCSGTPCFQCSSSNLCACIHHPNVESKRITFSQDAMTHSVYGGGTVPPPGNDDSHLWVKWDPDPVFPPSPGTGIPPQATEPGSSGSPLYNSARRYVGQLHGGPSACGATGNNLSDYYGLFHMSWDAGGSAATEAKDWLDPSASGATTLDGINACTALAVPGGLTATPNGANRIDLSWTAVPGAEHYRIYRGGSTCPGTGVTLLAEVATNSYSDLAVSGGSTYSYQVSSIDDDAQSCESARGACDDAAATGNCTLAPAFTGLATAASIGSSFCGVDLDWSTGSSSCGGGVVYNVYRSTNPTFTPGPSNLVASCLAATRYQDGEAAYGTTYYYAVRAEDQTGFGTGNCAAGNEDGNLQRRSASPAGADVDQFLDAIEGGAGNWTVAGSGAGSNFAISTAQSHSATHAWFVSDPSSSSDRQLQITAAQALPAAPASKLEFWHRYASESPWDGGVLETSTNGTVWSDVLAGNPGRFLAGGYVGTLNSGTANPLTGRAAWFGDSGVFVKTTVDLADFAGQSLYFRWRFGSDGSVAATGWYVDDVRLFHGAACAAGLLFSDDYELGSIERWSSVSP